MSKSVAAVSGAWATDYYVVGSMTNWEKNDQYKMTLNASAGDGSNLLGCKVAPGYRGIVVRNGKKYVMK